MGSFSKTGGFLIFAFDNFTRPVASGCLSNTEIHDFLFFCFVFSATAESLTPCQNEGRPLKKKREKKNRLAGVASLIVVGERLLLSLSTLLLKPSLSQPLLRKPCQPSPCSPHFFLYSVSHCADAFFFFFFLKRAHTISFFSSGNLSLFCCCCFVLFVCF